MDMPEEDSRCPTKVLDGARHFSAARQFRSARQGWLRMTSNFGRSYLLRLNSDLGVLGLYGKPIESRIHSYA